MTAFEWQFVGDKWLRRWLADMMSQMMRENLLFFGTGVERDGFFDGIGLVLNGCIDGSRAFDLIDVLNECAAQLQLSG